jgi:hypothetical protein
LDTPINVSYTAPGSTRLSTAVTKNISPDGIRFETHDRTLEEESILELKLEMAGTENPVHARGRVVWKKKLTLEDAAPFDVGMEITEIENDNKNTYLKFMCDLIYSIPRAK